MRYRIHSSDIQDFYRNRYLQTEKEAPFCSMADIIEADPFKMSIKEWKTPSFKAQLIQIKSIKELQVCGEIEDNVVMLHFVSKGDISLVYDTNHSLKMNENTNNVFTSLKKKVKHHFFENRQYEYFKVFLPYDFVYSISDKNPEVFGPFIKSVEKHRQLMIQDHCLTTMEMQFVIDQIKNCQVMGNIAPFYFDTKVTELFFLQLQQKSSQKCNTCTSYKHYNDQVNKARNIIESQYQNPPTIKELASAVGMSATILKASFKLFFGTTIYGYLFDYRMNIARKLLFDTSYSIAEIAERSGYEHASHFTIAFKRKFGISPGAYKKKVA